MRSAGEALILALISIVVAGLVVPYIANVRQAADRIQCANNLKLIAMSAHNYNDTYNYFPRAARPNPSLASEQRLSWLVEILPFVESDWVYSRVDMEKAWDAEENRFAAVMTIKLFQCPGFLDQPPESTLAPSHYIGIHRGGANAAMADGSVRWLDGSMDQRVLEAMVTVKGGDEGEPQ
jgi:prepilin-type processing-associated H-X9-DG protein